MLMRRSLSVPRTLPSFRASPGFLIARPRTLENRSRRSQRPQRPRVLAFIDPSTTDTVIETSYYVGKSITLFVLFVSTLNWLHYKEAREKIEKVLAAKDDKKAEKSKKDQREQQKNQKNEKRQDD